MIDKIKRISSRRIITFTAIGLITAFIVNGLVGYVVETSARKNGSLTQYTISATDFVWNGIKVKEGVVITTDNDPQMLLETPQKFSSLKFYMECSIYPGEMCIYYTEPGDQAFSAHKRLWVVPTDQTGWYMVETSMLDVTALRLDPTMYAGNVLTFGDFIFNAEKTIGEYFEISYGDVFDFIIYTGIISSVMKFLQEMLKREID